ncbi:MAG: SRPBCC domain-containing protein [Saprospiraceae bacterium]|nr:SRPBCC domain-containing protein [Saprospiraceae bacterium]
MEFTLTTRFKTSAKEIYTNWLNSEGHTKMTGGKATASDRIGERFTAWDGYIEGKNLILEPLDRIVQSWRTSDFKEEEGDSQIELTLQEIDGQTELTLLHTNVPDSGEHYIKGWDDHYFQPMQAYFST